jgi:hypothetical protein
MEEGVAASLFAAIGAATMGKAHRTSRLVLLAGGA